MCGGRRGFFMSRYGPWSLTVIVGTLCEGAVASFLGRGDAVAVR